MKLAIFALVLLVLVILLAIGIVESIDTDNDPF
jgi:hypothetical protein